MNAEEIKQVFACFKKKNPNPTTELIYHSPFELLIAVILSAQATDISVNKATSKLFKIANTPNAILKLGIDGLLPFIKHIGLHQSKAKYILNTCQILISEFDNQVPQSRKELESLPGVGRKTANVILNTAFGQPLIAVDTHVFRVANRIGIAQGKTPIQVEQQLAANVPPQYKYNAHHWLILHGRYICTAKRPKCGLCPIYRYCKFDQKTATKPNSDAC